MCVGIYNARLEFDSYCVKIHSRWYISCTRRVYILLYHNTSMFNAWGSTGSIYRRSRSVSKRNNEDGEQQPLVTRYIIIFVPVEFVTSRADVCMIWRVNRFYRSHSDASGCWSVGIIYNIPIIKKNLLVFQGLRRTKRMSCELFPVVVMFVVRFRLVGDYNIRVKDIIGTYCARYMVHEMKKLFFSYANSGRAFILRKYSK